MLHIDSVAVTVFLLVSSILAGWLWLKKTSSSAVAKVGPRWLGVWYVVWWGPAPLPWGKPESVSGSWLLTVHVVSCQAPSRFLHTACYRIQYWNHVHQWLQGEAASFPLIPWFLHAMLCRDQYCHRTSSCVHGLMCLRCCCCLLKHHKNLPECKILRDETHILFLGKCTAPLQTQPIAGLPTQMTASPLPKSWICHWPGCLNFWYILYVSKLFLRNYEDPEFRGPGSGERHWRQIKYDKAFST